MSLMIYGASGYTGTLIATVAVEAGLTPILAGRSASTLTPLATKLGLETRVFPVNRPELGGVTVLLNVAGPFAQTSVPLAEACITSGVHYLDIAGEWEEFVALESRSALAKERGVMLLPGVGFGVVPSDCLAAQVTQRLPHAVRLTIAFDTMGGVSRGTLLTVLTNLRKQGARRIEGRLAPTKPASHSLKLEFDNKDFSFVLNPWRADTITAWHSTRISNIECYSRFPRLLIEVMHASGKWGKFCDRRLIPLLKRWAATQPDGPSAAKRASGKTLVFATARRMDGDEVAAVLVGPEAYTFTARTAVAAATRVLGGAVVPGFQTPTTALGARFVNGIEGVTVY